MGDMFLLKIAVSTLVGVIVFLAKVIYVLYRKSEERGDQCIALAQSLLRLGIINETINSTISAISNKI